MLNLRTLILGQPRTCPQTGLQNEPKYSEKQSEFGTVNWTPYLFIYYSVLLVDFIVLVYYCRSTLQKYSDIIVPARKNRKNFHSLPMFSEFCNMEIAI